MFEQLGKIIYNNYKQYNFDPMDIMNRIEDRLIKEMDEGGIDKIVILGLDYDYIFRGKVYYK